MQQAETPATLDVRGDPDSCPSVEDHLAPQKKDSYPDSLQQCGATRTGQQGNKRPPSKLVKRVSKILAKVRTAGFKENALQLLSSAVTNFELRLVSSIYDHEFMQPNAGNAKVQVDHREDLQSTCFTEEFMQPNAGNAEVQVAHREDLQSTCFTEENCDSTVVCEKDGSPWKDGCKNANESLEDYLRRMEQYAANVSLEHHAEPFDSLPADFLTVCEIAAKTIDSLSETVGPVDLSQVLQDLKENTISVAFVGRHKSGMSTLINALLSKRLLPTSRINATAMVTIVEHTPDLKVPQLMNCTDELLARGEDQIFECIKVKNLKIRANEERSETLRVCTDVQLFASRQGNQKMRLIDTPGQGASGINLASDSNFPKSSAAFVFAMPYTQLGDREDITILKEILRADPHAIADMRLLIAITQHDLHYTDDAGLELDALDVTTYVQNCLSQRQLDIHSNSVIQVSGLWALLASDLRNIPSDTGIGRKAQEVYEMLPDKCKSDVTCGDVTEAIEITSNIRKLQSRVQQMIEDSSVLRKSTRSKFQGTLKQAIDKLQSKLEDAAINFLDQSNTKAKLMKCQEYIQQAEERLQKDVDQLGEILLTMFSKDVVPYLSIVIKETDDILQQFLHQQESPCISSQIRFTEDLMECIKVELLPKIKDVFKHFKCEGTRSLMEIFEVVLTQEFENMAAKAEDVLHDFKKKVLELQLEPTHIECIQDVENLLLNEWKREIEKSNVEDSVPIPREAAVTLIDKNGCICSRLFKASEKSIIKQLSATAKRNMMQIREKFCEIYESKLEERELENKQELEKAAQDIHLLVNQLRKLQRMHQYFLCYSPEE